MRKLFLFFILVGLVVITPIFIKPVFAVGSTSGIVIDPATIKMSVDQSQKFKVMAVASDNTMVEVTDQATLSTNDPLGKFVGNNYTPGKAGSWKIMASFESFSATATITVTPGTVKEITINPNSEPELTTVGNVKNFSVTVYDAENNILTNQNIVWSVIGDIGAIDDHGIFTPKTIGTGKVQAAVGTVTGQVSVVVNASTTTNVNSASANNTNSTSNTNSGVSQNVNMVSTDPINVNTVTASAVTINNNSVNVNSDTIGDEKTASCTSLKPWVWILILVVFLIVVAILFALVPVTEIWPAVGALALAAILAYIQRKYDCNSQSWWAWVVTLGTILCTSIALFIRTRKK